MFYFSKPDFHSSRARRFFEALIIVPAVYLALQQHPSCPADRIAVTWPKTGLHAGQSHGR